MNAKLSVVETEINFLRKSGMTWDDIVVAPVEQYLHHRMFMEPDIEASEDNPEVGREETGFSEDYG